MHYSFMSSSVTSSNQIIDFDKIKIAYNKLYDLNSDGYQSKYKKTFDLNFNHYVRSQTRLQIVKIKRQILFNQRRNINDINIYHMIDDIKNSMIITDKMEKKRRKYAKWISTQRKIVKNKIKAKKQQKINSDKKENSRLGSLYHYHNRPKYLPPNNQFQKNIEIEYYSNIGFDKFFAATKIQKFFRGYFARKVVNEHLNTIIKRHIEIKDDNLFYYTLPFSIKLSFANLISGSDKSIKFNNWIIRTFKLLYPQFNFIPIQNNLFDIQVVDFNNITVGFIYCRNVKGTINPSNTEIKKMKNYLLQFNLTYNNIYITTTSRITDNSIKKFNDIGVSTSNIISIDNIINFITRLYH